MRHPIKQHSPHIKRGSNILNKINIEFVIRMIWSTSSHAKTLVDKVNQYFLAQESVEQQYTKLKDVDNLLALLTSYARFEHPSFNVIQSKSEYKTGLLYYMGKYGSCNIKVERMIEGLNAVMAEYIHTCVDQEGKRDEDSQQKLVTLFEFNNGKIKLIRHYF